MEQDVLKQIEMAEKICLDTSIVIDKFLSKNLDKFKNLKKIIIPIPTLDELQNQASKGRKEGFIGLNEIKEIREKVLDKKISIEFSGERPSLEDIKLARSGRIDSLIREIAKKEDAYLLTADFVQSLVAEAEGVKVIYIAPQIFVKEKLKFEEFFDNETLSIHLKEKVIPFAKRGKPGNWKLVKLAENPLSNEEIEEIIREIVEFARRDENSYFEIVREGSMVIQMKNYRIAIAMPPFSDGYEVTVVRPIVKLRLEDYKPTKRLLERLEKKAEGIIICGPPGSGKSTFCSSLIEFYLNMGKIVKTLESPRDLQVPEEVTQYGPLENSFEKTADILLLVRPDYVAFDEIRKTKDFEIFADLRLAGIGMIGVVHASEAIDAIQRFLSRYELGMLPHIVDTIIFIKDGEIKKILTLEIKVKVPTGMTEEDLARPVVEVRDFESGKLEYEIYTFGEENVVVPIKEEKKSAIYELAKQKIMDVIRKFDEGAEIEFISENRVLIRVDNENLPKIIGKEGSRIKKIEEMLGISIDVEPKIPSLGKKVDFLISESGNSLIFRFLQKLSGKNVKFYVNDKFLFSANVGKDNTIRLNKNNEFGEMLMKAIIKKEKIEAFV
ncbi:MAG: PINc/VapC family ATPase [Candidatus Aenigmatarchaeota archaeon]